jgi:hypothetical protein
VPVCCSASAEILDAAGRVIPLSVRNVFNQHENVIGICNYELKWQPDGGSQWWLDTNTIAALQRRAIWMDDDSFIKPLAFASLGDLNQGRETLAEKLESASSIVVCEGSVDAKVFDSLPDGEWTYRLEDAISVLFPFAASGNVAPFVSMYHAGDLVYTSFIDFVERVFEETRSLLARRRYFGSLILSRLRSRKGLADTVDLFLNQRSWYLHHRAHPPELTIKAEGRFAATTRRVCFRPLPA